MGEEGTEQSKILRVCVEGGGTNRAYENLGDVTPYGSVNVQRSVNEGQSATTHVRGSIQKDGQGRAIQYRDGCMYVTLFWVVDPIKEFS